MANEVFRVEICSWFARTIDVRECMYFIRLWIGRSSVSPPCIPGGEVACQNGAPFSTESIGYSVFLMRMSRVLWAILFISYDEKLHDKSQYSRISESYVSVLGWISQSTSKNSLRLSTRNSLPTTSGPLLVAEVNRDLVPEDTPCPNEVPVPASTTRWDFPRTVVVENHVK